ncbi:UNVERIFIED_CONTAM: hypothetical protein Sangu_2579600 [Sesamum angustifolium]|uniref:Reverse transcriptase RNase H-like domain-containing protein n=1 Tax=Sesamum angustifolium TaxID=2727405 RepID=A0AAW2J766_9LAMI
MDRKKVVHQGILENCKPLDGLVEEGSEVGVDRCLRGCIQVAKASHLITVGVETAPFDKPFEVQVDSSDRALEGVLVQDKHPVAFESRKLKDVELRYNTHEMEMMAVVHCLETWRHYLLGTKFTVVTDSVTNTYFETQQKLSPK